MKSTNFQYGLAMLPVLVKSVLSRNAGPLTLHEYLPYARTELASFIARSRKKRGKATKQLSSRPERRTVNRYFDLAQRAFKSYRLSLENIQKYLDHGDNHWLEQALLHFETGDRYQDNRLRLRMSIAPTTCNRLSRAC